MWLFAFIFALSATSTDPQALVVDARLVGGNRVTIGQPVTLAMNLFNRGHAPQHVVRPGDGSESGWREPHVFFSAERQVGQGWEPVATQPIMRCGLFDPDWNKDVIALRPGEHIVLKDWLPDPSYSLALDKPGRYRLTVHYAFGNARKGQDAAPAPDGPMRDVAPFEVVSAPVTFELVAKHR